MMRSRSPTPAAPVVQIEYAAVTLTKDDYVHLMLALQRMLDPGADAQDAVAHAEAALDVLHLPAVQGRRDRAGVFGVVDFEGPTGRGAAR